ncbi:MULTISPECIES: TraR/DksA C4-type zinc finger protein [unclassified Ekhidna]|jgi:DnaK suppressor protein|uniref:TraR/DksA family transcriptional regulator n=1 Tax=unclassified Ekhidna TaxID=2632188 RepID=UPI0032E01215
MEVDEIRKKIEEEISKTTLLINEYKEQSKPVSLDNSIGRISRMDAINNKSITESALRQAEGRLSKLNQALGNVGKPDFGTCIKCKQPIPIGRILLMPESNKCVNCAR